MTFAEEAVRATKPDCRWLTIGAALGAAGGWSTEFDVPWVSIPLIFVGLGFMAYQWWRNVSHGRSTTETQGHEGHDRT